MAFVTHGDEISVGHHSFLFFLQSFIGTVPRGRSAGYHMSKYRFDLRNKCRSPSSRHRLEVASDLAEGVFAPGRILFNLPET